MKYIEQMKEDIMDYIRAHDVTVTAENRDEVYYDLDEDLWLQDCVTGNASGSYYCNASKAKEQVFEDGEEYIRELIPEFGITAEEISEHLFDFEWWDVSIRCYLLGQVIDIVLDELLA